MIPLWKSPIKLPVELPVELLHISHATSWRFHKCIAGMCLHPPFLYFRYSKEATDP